MNHELKLCQLLQAQIGEHNASFSIIFHSGKREFTGIVTIRNILELIISLCETLETVTANTEDNTRHIPTKELMQKRFVEQFLQSHMVSEEEHHNAADQSKSFLTSEGSEDLGLLPRIDSAMIHGYDLSHLSSILNDITIQEWRQSNFNKVTFRKSKLIDSLDVEDTLYEALTKMQEGLNFLAFVSKDKTRLFGCLQMSDVLQFMTTHWIGKDLSIFRIPLRSLDMLF